MLLSYYFFVCTFFVLFILSSSFLERQKLYFILFARLGTQSPDAVNKLLRLSDSSHQIKSVAQRRANHVSTSSSPSSATSLTNPESPSPSNLTISTATGLSSLSGFSLPSHNRHHHHHLTKMRDTNKLTCESSSLNLKQPTSSSSSYLHLIRTHARKYRNGT